jgi:hypothetical protein
MDEGEASLPAVARLSLADLSVRRVPIQESIMTPVRVIGRDAATGKCYVAMKGEAGSKTWGWLEVKSPVIADDKPDMAGDMIIDFPAGSMGHWPVLPPTLKMDFQDAGGRGQVHNSPAEK